MALQRIKGAFGILSSHKEDVIMMLNDVNPTRRRSLILNAAVELKKVQTLTIKERIFVEDIIKKITYREISSSQIKWLESLTEKYGIIAR